MSTIRFFSGGRDLNKGKKSIAHEIMKIEFQKKGRMEPAEKFKLIMKRKLDESKTKLLLTETKRPMSAKAQKALKDIAHKKAVKEAKRIRQMVMVQPKIYSNGRLTKKGAFYDIAGNKIGDVNRKNGNIKTVWGTALGKYQPKSHFVNATIQNAINQYSPYYINLRKMQAMQAAGLDPLTGQPLLNNEVIDVNHHHAQHGGAPHQYQSISDYVKRHDPDNPYELHGEGASGPRQNVGATAWGAVSDNVWGSFTDNAWGTSTDNVWGGNSSDVWGGVGGSPFGHFGKSVQFWGTGNGVNILKKMAEKAAAFFGMHLRLGTGKSSVHEGPRRSRTAASTTRSNGSSSQSTSRTTRSSSGTNNRSGSSSGSTSRVSTTRAPSAPVGHR